MTAEKIQVAIDQLLASGSGQVILAELFQICDGNRRYKEDRAVTAYLKSINLLQPDGIPSALVSEIITPMFEVKGDQIILK